MTHSPARGIANLQRYGHKRAQDCVSSSLPADATNPWKIFNLL